MFDQTDFEKSINDIVVKLVRDYQPEKIVLYGSCAHGATHTDSDIDMLIIKETDSKRFVDRWVEVTRITRDLHRRIPFEPLVYTSSEIEDRLEKKDLFIREILEKGKVLYER